MSASIPNTTGTYLSIAFPTNVPAGTDATLMCWFYLNNAATTTYRQMMWVVGGEFGQGTAQTTTSINFGTSNADYVGQALNVQNWYHTTYTVRSTSTSNHYINGYINGQLNVSVNDTSTFGAYTAIDLGNSFNGGTNSYTFPLNGAIQGCRVWFNRALNAAEVANEMNSKEPVSTAGLYLWAPLYDNLSNEKVGNHLIVNNGTGIINQAGPLFAYTKSRRVI